VLAYCDETGEALAGLLRPGNAGSNTAADQIAVIEDALAQIPVGQIEQIEILMRADSAGATHDLLDFCREGRLRYSVGYELSEPVRAAILQVPEQQWIASLTSDGSERPNGQICEITDLLNLAGWPTGSRVIVRRERAHPGAQLSFTDHDGHRFQAVLTDQAEADIQVLERRHRQRARCEDHIATTRTPACATCPQRLRTQPRLADCAASRNPHGLAC